MLTSTALPVGTMDGVLGKLKNLDAYPKVNEDFFTRTFSGGVITIVSSIVMFCLFISEFGKSSMLCVKPLADSDYIATSCSPVSQNDNHQRAFS